jgi:hypothetical protein
MWESDVRRLNPRRFLHSRQGGSAAEFTLVAILFLTFIFGIIDFGRALWEWNEAQMATAFGARFAAVNPMVATAWQDFDGLSCAGVGNGQTVPNSCLGANPNVCTSASCSSGARNTPAFNAILAQVQKYYPKVAAANLVVEYRHVGLGFAGNPYGSDIVPAVTVRLQNMQFDFVTPGLAGMVSIPMPSFAATLTGEDFN